MAGNQEKAPEFNGPLEKYPGLFATIITVIIGVVFVGALYNTATSGHHGEEHHGEAHHEDGGEHKDEGGH